MQYISTRGEAPKLGFDDVLLAGLADGWRPVRAGELAAGGRRNHAQLAGALCPIQELAVEVMLPFRRGKQYPTREDFRRPW